MSVNYDCNGHIWTLIFESVDGTKKVFKCINCPYVYEQIIVKQYKNTK